MGRHPARRRIVYVSRAMQALWEARGDPWQEIAALNLRRLAEAEPYSHLCARGDSSPYMVTMLYGQNLASSRLLVPNLFKTTFPQGYMVAVPEMTCALAFTATPSPDEAQAIDDLITSLFKNGDEPVSTGHCPPEEMWQRDSNDLGLPG